MTAVFRIAGLVLVALICVIIGVAIYNGHRNWKTVGELSWPTSGRILDVCVPDGGRSVVVLTDKEVFWNDGVSSVGITNVIPHMVSSPIGMWCGGDGNTVVVGLSGDTAFINPDSVSNLMRSERPGLVVHQWGVIPDRSGRGNMVWMSGIGGWVMLLNGKDKSSSSGDVPGDKIVSSITMNDDFSGFTYTVLGSSDRRVAVIDGGRIRTVPGSQAASSGSVFIDATRKHSTDGQLSAYINKDEYDTVVVKDTSTDTIVGRLYVGVPIKKFDFFKYGDARALFILCETGTVVIRRPWID